MMKIVFPEYKNPVIKEAISRSSEVEALEADDLESACKMVAEGQAVAMVAGIDYTSRDVILSCRDFIGVKGKTFSASFVMKRSAETYVLADAAACKNPTTEQLSEIVMQTYETAKRTLISDPKVAVLSFSTMGSGGKDESIARAQEVVRMVRERHPEVMIDGEMQLDAAINQAIGKKKAPESEVAGRANVLICPDLNSGNILYKAMEQFGGFVAAGPILQGFKAPISDLSRGSTVEDVLAVIEVMKKLA